MPIYSQIQNIQNFNPTGPAQVVVAIIFYGLAVVVTVLGFSTIYVLIRNGRSRGFSFAISLVYLLFYVTLMMQGIGILNSLK